MKKRCYSSVSALLAVALVTGIVGCKEKGGGQQPASQAAATGTAAVESLTPSGTMLDGVRVVKVEAKQYEFIPAKIVVEEGDKVQVDITATDVEHGFALADYGIDQKVAPGKTETVTFTADKPGTHEFHCSVYCGPGHREMKGELVVLAAQK